MEQTEREEELKKFEEFMRLKEKRKMENILKNKFEKENSIYEYNARRIEKKDIFKTDNFYKENKYNFYDILIKINSLSDLKKNGCEIIYPSNNFNERYINEYIITVGVIGTKKKGKSFLLNKLFNIDFPHGFEIDTEGISFKYLIDEQILFGIIDTVGIDQSITNDFIKDFVLSKSKIIIVVVELLTNSEQRQLLDDIKNSLEDIEEIIVIHNLYNFDKIHQVKNYINNILRTYIDLNEINMEIYDNDNENDIYNKTCFIENFSNFKKNITIKHFILANDSIESEAGNYYNFSTIYFLKNFLMSEGNPKKFDLLSELKDFIFNNSYKYFKRNDINESEETIYPIDFDKIQILENENNKKKIILPSNLDIKLINNINKESFNFEKFFVPKYSYYKKRVKKSFINKNINDKEKEKVEVLVIEIELNGKIKELKQKINIDKYNYYNFLIAGKEELKDNNDIIIENNDKENKFKLEFKINMDELQLKNYNLIKFVKKM